jgi:hypothetical protein
MPRCAEAAPPLYEMAPDHHAACYLYADRPARSLTEIAAREGVGV